MHSVFRCLVKHLIRAKGKASKELAEQALLDWAAHEEWLKPLRE